MGSLIRSGPIQKRLEYAAMDLAILREDDVTDDDMRERFVKLKQALTNKPATTEGDVTIAATTRQLTDEEAERLADECLSLFVEVCGGL